MYICFLYKFSPFSLHLCIHIDMEAIMRISLTHCVVCIPETHVMPFVVDLQKHVLGLDPNSDIYILDLHSTNSKIYVSIVGHVWSLLIWSIHRPFACECEKCLAFPKSKALAADAIWP